MSEVKCPSCGTSINVPDKKAGLWWGLGCLLAVPAFLMLVAFIGLLAAIAIPSFMKARDTSQLNCCVNNMRMVEAAKDKAVMEHGYKPGDSVPERDLSSFIKNGFTNLLCPKGGHYTINPAVQDPACSVHGTLSETSHGMHNRL